MAVPEPDTLAGLIAPQVNPDGGESLRVTVPANPLSEATVIVDVAETPTVTAAGEVADMLKSGERLTVHVATVEWVSDPLVPVIVTE